MSDRYRQSELLLERAEKRIPLGSQTFSKSKTQYPLGASPYFVSKAEGSRIWDVDGNEYIDFVSALNAINLGYNDKDVNKAVMAQVEKGSIFSLAHELEIKVAEKICEIVPCAEMVRFGKNGSDATAGAVRLARAYTGKDHVMVCGYHGWQDWYIASTTKDLGIPKVVKSMTHRFEYNNLDSLSQLFNEYAGNVAAVVIEPVNIYQPKDNFLQKVKDLAHQNGAVLIFDETITGFRHSLGGAQELFGVIPDVATFGKGLANGYPLSAVAGKAEIMKFMEEIFFSFTYGGETISLAASLAVLEKLQNEPVIETMDRRGRQLVDGLNLLIEKHDLGHVFKLGGYPVWSFLLVSDTDKYSSWEIKTFLQQEMFKNGILFIGTHNISYAHTESDVNTLLETYDKFFAHFRKVYEASTLLEALDCKPIVPLFKVRG